MNKAVCSRQDEEYYFSKNQMQHNNEDKQTVDKLQSNSGRLKW